MEDIMRHYHIDIPARHTGRAAIVRAYQINEGIKNTIYQIAKDHGLSDIYVLSEDEIAQALREYTSRKDFAHDAPIKIAALEHENKQLKEEIMCKDTTIDNALAAIRRQADKHNKEVAELYGQISALTERLRCSNDTIQELLNIRVDDGVKPQEEIPSCGYYCEGRCKGQKMMPDCTPYTGYCPVAGRESST